MPTRTTGPLLRLLAFEALAVTVLCATAGPLDAGAAGAGTAFLARATTAELAGTVAWWAAAVLVAWLVAGTATCLAARVVPGLAALRTLDRWTAPAVRRVVDRALVCSFAASTLVVTGAAPGGTTTAPPPAIVHVTPDGELVLRPRPPATAATPPAVARRPSPSPSPAPALAPAPARPPAQHAVAPGDNLWAIAAAHLAAHGGAPVADALVASYWRRLVDANRATLRSGDPNLIFPGELLTLPT
jgi:hypothetical protein